TTTCPTRLRSPRPPPGTTSTASPPLLPPVSTLRVPAHPSGQARRIRSFRPDRPNSSRPALTSRLRRGRRRPSTTRSLGRSRPLWRPRNKPPEDDRAGWSGAVPPGLHKHSPPNPPKDRIMSDNSHDFPIVLGNESANATPT